MALLVPSLLILAAAAAPDAGTAQADPHGAAVERRGDRAMGFSHDRTAHHFGLTRSGGFISAESKDPSDGASRDAIVRHFRHIAAAFRRGEFDMPMFIHDRVPPGVPEMKRLAAEIDYRVVETSSGARVTVTTGNPQALRAVHDFLRFQIEDHRTGDSEEVQP